MNKIEDVSNLDDDNGLGNRVQFELKIANKKIPMAKDN